MGEPERAWLGDAACHGGTVLNRGALFLFALTACQSVLGFKHGKPMPKETAEAGGGGKGGKGAGGATAGSSSGATGGDAGTRSGNGGASGGGSAGRGETVTQGGSGGVAGSGGKGVASSSGSGGVDKSAGDAGDGGEAGGAEPCRKNEDCPNPDPDCRAECRPSAQGNACVIVAVDKDGDLHGSDACEAEPGDDCDDTRPSVYKDAQELCDGRDNDCDGKRDFEEENILLSGTTRTLTEDPTYDVDVAWSESQRTWGVLWCGTSATLYEPLDLTGAPRIEPVAVSDFVGSFCRITTAEGREETARAVLPPTPAPHTVALRWGEDLEGTGAFAVAFPGYASDFFVGLVGADGSSVVPAIPLSDMYGGFGSEAPALEWFGSQGVWAAAWTDVRDNIFQAFVRTVSLSGSFGPELNLGAGGEPRIAVGGDDFLVVWNGSPNAEATLLSGALSPSPVAVGEGLTLKDPTVASQSDRYGVVWLAPPDKFAFAEIGRDGGVLCGPVLREKNGFVFSDIVPHDDGFLILGGQPSVQMLEVLPGCTFGSTIEVAPTPARFVRGASAGEDGLLVAWGTSDQPLQSRALKRYLCR